MSEDLFRTSIRFRQGDLRDITLTGYGYCTAVIKENGREVFVAPGLMGWYELVPREKVNNPFLKKFKMQGGRDE